MDKNVMNKLYKEYGLTVDDTFKHAHYTIITRAGIDKIQAAANINVEYDIVDFNVDTRPTLGNAPNPGFGNYLSVIVKCTGTLGESKIVTFGECDKANNKNAYPWAMAEKRAMARAVLKLAGLYQEGFFSEDEADNFKRPSKPVTTVQVKV